MVMSLGLASPDYFQLGVTFDVVARMHDNGTCSEIVKHLCLILHGISKLNISKQLFTYHNFNQPAMLAQCGCSKIFVSSLT